MSRWVVPSREGLKAATGESPDGPTARVVKYVPAEIVAAYTLVFTGLVTLNPQGKQGPWVAAGLIAAFLIVTIVFVWTRTPKEVRKAHLLISPLAFVAWSYPISSAMLGDWFYGLAAFIAQALVIALSVLIAPRA